MHKAAERCGVPAAGIEKVPRRVFEGICRVDGILGDAASGRVSVGMEALVASGMQPDRLAGADALTGGFQRAECPRAFRLPSD